MPRKRGRPLLPALNGQEQEREPRDTAALKPHLAGEFGAIESLFTPEGIEWVEATRDTGHDRRRRAYVKR